MLKNFSHTEQHRANALHRNGQLSISQAALRATHSSRMWWFLQLPSLWVTPTGTAPDLSRYDPIDKKTVSVQPR